MRTSSRVRLVSAIELASTSLRMPGLGEASAARCCAGSIPPWRRWRTMSGGRSPSASAVRSISATPGRKASSEPSCSAQRIADRRSHLRLDPLRRIAAFMDQRQADGSCPRFRSGRVAQQPREAVAVQGRRHRQDAQIGAQCRRRHRASSASARSLSRLRSCTSSNSTAADAGQLRIGLEPRQEDTMGHGDHPRRPAHPAVEAGCITNCCRPLLRPARAP